jgi:hypothetical protein
MANRELEARLNEALKEPVKCAGGESSLVAQLEQAIDRSIFHGSIVEVRVENVRAALDELIVLGQCDASELDRGGTDVWGEDDEGQPWRLTLRRL